MKGLAERSERMGILLRDELATLPSSIVKQVQKFISIGEVYLICVLIWINVQLYRYLCPIVQVRGKGLLNAIVISPEFSATEVNMD